MRRYVRHPSDIPIDIEVCSEAQLRDTGGCLTTVSLGGMSCEVPFRVAVGSTVNIDIPSVSPPYRGVGEVVWCREKGEHFLLGVEFSDTEEAFKSRMVQQLCQIEDYKNRVLRKEGRVLDGDQAAAEWIAKYAVDFPR